MKALLLQDNYGQNIRECFELVKARAEAFTRMVSTLAHEATMRNELRIQGLETTVLAGFESVKQSQTAGIKTLTELLTSIAHKAACMLNLINLPSKG